MFIFKLLGCTLVLAVSSLIGIVLAKAYSMRVNNIMDMITAFEILYTKISYNQSTLDEIFTDIGVQLGGPIGEIFNEMGIAFEGNLLYTADELWIKVIEENISKCDFSFDDIQVINEFSYMLGKSDIEGQLRNINMTLSRLKSQLIRAENEERKYSKMYKNVGILGGMGLAVILI